MIQYGYEFDAVDGKVARCVVEQSSWQSGTRVIALNAFWALRVCWTFCGTHNPQNHNHPVMERLNISRPDPSTLPVPKSKSQYSFGFRRSKTRLGTQNIQSSIVVQPRV